MYSHLKSYLSSPCVLELYDIGAIPLIKKGKIKVHYKPHAFNKRSEWVSNGAKYQQCQACVKR